MSSDEGLLIAIVGETATGKSTLAMRIAERFNGEIINADSWQVYRGMDIGTAKPTPKQQAKIPHHLVDIINPDEDFTAAAYQRLALRTIDTITSNNRLPILVGGTGLYIDSVLFNYSFAPEGASGQRQQLNQRTIPELIDMIKQQNISLQGIDTRNKRRLVRLLETGGRRPSKSLLRPNTLVIGLQAENRGELRHNIEKRVEVMFRRGLKHEVRELVNLYGWDVEAMKGIGYREFKPYFAGEQSLVKTKQKIVKNTLKLAKKQRTWFKRNRHIQWFSNLNSALETVGVFINEPSSK